MLTLARYHVTFEALEPRDLPAYLGSTLRGFGRAFRQLCCPVRRGEPCPIPDACSYHLVFETAPPPGAEALRTHDEIPRPFVIAPPPPGAEGEAAGAGVVFDLILIRRAREFLPHFVVTLRAVDRIGRGRRAVALAHIDVEHPLTGEPAAEIRLVADETRWTAWTRYSVRQDRRMEWTGIAGAATYAGDLAPFWPHLVFGQWTHVGKGATFGLGRYGLEPAEG